MPASVKQFMRYWGFFLGKMLLAGSVILALLAIVNHFFSAPHSRDYDRYLVYLVCMGVAFLVSVGLVYLCILDQRYRCRVCLRRLRMPIETGSWSKMLQFGRPHIEYICVYGHGKLNIPELHLTGMDSPAWTEHADYWAELCGTGVGSSERKQWPT